MTLLCCRFAAPLFKRRTAICTILEWSLNTSIQQLVRRGTRTGQEKHVINHKSFRPGRQQATSNHSSFSLSSPLSLLPPFYPPPLHPSFPVAHPFSPALIPFSLHPLLLPHISYFWLLVSVEGQFLSECVLLLGNMTVLRHIDLLPLICVCLCANEQVFLWVILQDKSGNQIKLRWWKSGRGKPKVKFTISSRLP